VPLFEYTCQSCSHAFETLVRTGDVPTCPECNSDHLAKRLSVFAVNAHGSEPECRGDGSCGRCDHADGHGGCGMRPE